MPRDEEIERRPVDRRLGDARLCQQEAFGAFTFAIPFVLTRQHPDGVGHGLRRPMFLHQTRRHLRAHVEGDRARMFAAQAERFENALPQR